MPFRQEWRGEDHRCSDLPPRTQSSALSTGPYGKGESSRRR